MDETTEKVDLVGGPRDGDRIAVPAGADVWRIVKSTEPACYVEPEWMAAYSQPLITGTYRRRLGVFEWHGWDDER